MTKTEVIELMKSASSEEDWNNKQMRSSKICLRRISRLGNVPNKECCKLGQVIKKLSR